MNEFKAALAVSLASMACAVPAATIRVPDDVATIQGAIASAHAGDTVLVSPGTYDENIDFLGKAITVQSANGPAATIIDAGQRDSVVVFHASEGRHSVLKGFTLRNGNAAQYPLNGGGVNAVQTSPTIEGNWITGNSACDGNGVGLYFSGALVKNNRIYGNHQNGCGGGTLGGGIYIGGTGGAEVVGNVIENNQTDMAGGGIGMNATGTVQVKRNIVRANSAGNWGGGVAFINDSRPNFADNVVYGNTAPQGGGLYLSPPSGSPGGTWVNNTVADNFASSGGSELYTGGFAGEIELVNNIFRASHGSSAIYCDSTYSSKSPVFTTNDLYTTSGKLAEGACAGVLNQGGNVSVDPLFAGDRKAAGAYQLQAGSPAVDAGAPTSLAGKRDLKGHPRVVDGNGDAKAVIDLGAYEYSPQ
jgi:hypothetical protein